jgi:hypothetical protein
MPSAMSGLHFECGTHLAYQGLKVRPRVGEYVTVDPAPDRGAEHVAFHVVGQRGGQLPDRLRSGPLS